jgi:hypothetical protein
MRVCDNGWLAFSGTTSNQWVNKTVPSTVDPAGTVAPFFDDMQDRGPGASNLFVKRMEPGEDGLALVGHWIVQWHNMRHYSPGTTAESLNYEVKLFDDGVIEFHYGAMVTAAPASTFADGQSATVWLERPNGTAALALSINQPVVQPFSAYRFIPKK